MLDELSVDNLGVIGSITIEPGPGFVVVTGETGAGKTLLLGALRLLAGGPARKDHIGPAGEGAEVQGRFVVGDEARVVRRRIGQRSRAYLDGDMITVGELEAAIGSQVEIVGQNDHLRLSRPDGLRSLVDQALDADGKAALASYDDAYREMRRVQMARDELGGDRRALERELEVVRFQADEISAASLGSDELTALAATVQYLRNVDGIVQELEVISGLLDDDDGINARFGALSSAAQRLRRMSADTEDLSGQSAIISALLDEFSNAVSRQAGDIEHDPARLAEAEERIALINDLRRKYGESIDDVLKFGEEAVARSAALESLLGRADRIDGELAAARAVVDKKGEVLREHRRSASARVTQQSLTHLSELGLGKARVEFALEAAEPDSHGADAVTFAFASDTRLSAGPIHKTASGGELSRLVLALRLAAGAGQAPIVAFDEVDAGVGGSTALALGKKLAALSVDRQVFCVTHLPQVAAFADAHFVVSRTGIDASVTRVEGEERLQELSRMLSGLPESDRGRDHAAELLALAVSRR